MIRHSLVVKDLRYRKRDDLKYAWDRIVAANWEKVKVKNQKGKKWFSR